MPSSAQLIAKYLPLTFEKEFIALKDSITGKFSLICDESQDICSRPTICTLASYFDNINNVKQVKLVENFYADWFT
jgi:hypothetical protein